jgi:hypothetical protein
MSVAWTTILIISLLAPGVFFFIGYATRERYSREIVRSSAIGEVGLAILIAIIIHLLCWGILSVFGFDLAAYAKPLADFGNTPSWLNVDHIVSRIVPVALYLIATAILGFLLGCGFAWAVANGWLPFLATHKWLNEVARSMHSGLVTAYVMTMMKENNRVLMYKGILSEFYLKPEGTFAYVVLKRCSKFYMTFEEDIPMTGEQRQLFGDHQDQRPAQVWDYLLIDATNIANILFDPSPQIRETGAGGQALQAEFEAFVRATALRTGGAGEGGGAGGGAGGIVGNVSGGGTSQSN